MTETITPNRARTLRKQVRTARAAVAMAVREIRARRAHLIATSAWIPADQSDPGTRDDALDGLHVDLRDAVHSARYALRTLHASRVVLGSAYSDTAARRVIADLDARRSGATS